MVNNSKNIYSIIEKKLTWLYIKEGLVRMSYVIWCILSSGGIIFYKKEILIESLIYVIGSKIIVCNGVSEYLLESIKISVLIGIVVGIVGIVLNIILFIIPVIDELSYREIKKKGKGLIIWLSIWVIWWYWIVSVIVVFYLSYLKEAGRNSEIYYIFEPQLKEIMRDVKGFIKVYVSMVSISYIIWNNWVIIKKKRGILYLLISILITIISPPDLVMDSMVIIGLVLLIEMFCWLEKSKKNILKKMQ